MAKKKTAKKKATTEPTSSIGGAYAKAEGAKARALMRVLQDRYFGDIDMDDMKVPAGMVVAHNHIKPQRTININGFRAWWTTRDDEIIVPCRCGWAPKLAEHFRVRRSKAVERQNG
jgi:hypothetical protein